MFRNICLSVSLFLVSCGDVQSLKYEPAARDKVRTDSEKVTAEEKKKQTWEERFTAAEDEFNSWEVAGDKDVKDVEASEAVSSDGVEDTEEPDAYDEVLADKGTKEVDPYDEVLADKGAKGSVSDNSQLVIPTLEIKDFKGGKAEEEEGKYYTYYYTFKSYTVVLALNSYEHLKERIKKKPKALLIAKQDFRVVQDLILDKKVSYLLQIPLLAYTDLSQSLHEVYSEEQQKELEKFRNFKVKLKAFSSYSKAYKSKDFWSLVEKLAGESESCMNYKALLSWRLKMNPKSYSFVTSFEKLVDYNEYFGGLFEFERGRLKDYHFEEFESYKEINRKVKSLKKFRSKLDKNVLAMVKYVNDYGELVMRFDAQWGRRAKLLSDIDKMRKEDFKVSRREINQLLRKSESIDRLLDDMAPDIAKMNKGMDRYIRKYVTRLNKRNTI